MKLDKEVIVMPIDEEILRRLRTNDPALIRLDLSHKRLDDENIQELCEMLVHNKKLITLRLQGNRFGDVGVGFIVAALLQNSALKSLYLYDNNISWKGVLALRSKKLKVERIGVDYDIKRICDDIQSYISSSIRYVTEQADDFLCMEMAFWHALLIGDLEVVNLFLESGRRAGDIVDEEHGDMPLDIAADAGHVAIVKRLLEEPDVEVNEFGGDYYKTALQRASYAGHEDVVDILLADSRINVNARLDKEKETALHLAAIKGHIKIVKKLLDAGIDPFAGDDRAKTALHWAIASDHEGCAKIVDMFIKIPGMDDIILNEDNDVLQRGVFYGNLWLGKENRKNTKIQAIRNIKKYLDELPKDGSLKPICDKCLEVKSIALVMGEQLDRFIASIKKDPRQYLLRAQVKLKSHPLITAAEEQPRKRLRTR
jgi:ankyrin repeat protein